MTYTQIATILRNAPAGTPGCDVCEHYLTRAGEIRGDGVLRPVRIVRVSGISVQDRIERSLSRVLALGVVQRNGG